MTSNKSIVVRKTPNAIHLYTATIVRGNGVYGWGNTPDEARQKLAERLAVHALEVSAREERRSRMAPWKRSLGR